jgi:predicted DsbA family dithiol-disulfide isomerase
MMRPSHSLQQTIKLVYYTHPICHTGWAMQENWQRFLATYNHHMSIQFCIAREAADPGKDPDRLLSSYAACLAVKAASMQSPMAADLYLQRLREAAIDEQRDISQMGVLVDLARDVNKLHRSNFDYQRFGSDLDARTTRQALQTDLQKIYCNRIDTFPTLTLTWGGKGIKMVGFCTYQQLSGAMQKLLRMSQSNDLRYD